MLIIEATNKESVLAAAHQNPSLHVRGGGSKTALATLAPVLVDLSGLHGVLAYEPNEFTFTALAGTPIRTINELLGQHGQYLPFDPLLADKGATLGGTVAANSGGPGRYRYGGVRDFILGVQFVDGRGQLVQAGGKVVKNAAGFDIPKLMVGSLGQLGILLELTFKVFPQPQAYSTLKFTTDSLEAALNTMRRLFTAPLELDALDLTPPATLWLRQGGVTATLRPRLLQLQQFVGGGDVLTTEEDLAFWHSRRELTWVPNGATVVKIPLTPQRIPALEAALAPYAPERHYSAGGNVAWVAWSESVNELSHLLHDQQLRGLALLGQTMNNPLLGLPQANAFTHRVKTALDPDGKFGPGS
ncbi:MAG: FAD-binding protein [Chloroflexi bacterium]|nr:FAD-binding protein [Chloroflexota bacterium]